MFGGNDGTPARKDTAKRGTGDIGAERDDAVGAGNADADEGGFAFAGDEGGAGVKGEEFAGAGEATFGEDADDFAGTEQLDGAFEAGAVGLAAADGERAVPSDHFAEDRHLEELAFGHEVNRSRAGELNENGVEIGDMVGEDEEAAGARNLLVVFDDEGAEEGDEGPDERAQDGQGDEHRAAKAERTIEAHGVRTERKAAG